MSDHLFKQPTIIIGMHRSGTTMLVGLLNELGLFTGEKVDENKEATFFLNRNEWMMRMAGGGWDYPGPVKRIYESKELTEWLTQELRGSVKGREFDEFSGGRETSNGSLSIDWGWKDPRTIYLLPLWKKIYPGARLVYISRNGVDVANSLRVRAKKDIEEGNHGPFTKQPISWHIKNMLLPVPRFVLQSVRCLSLMESFNLWEEYTLEAEQVYQGFDGEKYRLRYEDVLLDPVSYLPELAKFIGLEFDETDIAKASAQVKKSRAYSFNSKEDLLAFYRQVKDRTSMKELGYDAIA